MGEGAAALEAIEAVARAIHEVDLAPQCIPWERIKNEDSQYGKVRREQAEAALRAAWPFIEAAVSGDAA